MKTQTSLAVAVLGATLLSGCGESSSSSAGPDFGGGNNGGTPPPTTEFNQAQLVANLADNVISPVFASAATAATELNGALGGYCAALQSGTDVAAAAQLAQTQWLATMAWWQQAELMQLGPLHRDTGLRNKIYSWPVVNRCAVDQEVVLFESGQINGQPYDISSRTDPRKGLDALEYLLFAPSLDHRCPASVAPANWNSRSDDDRRLARCQFAAAAAADLVTNLNSLNSQWQSFSVDLKNAGQPGSSYGDIHDAVNDLSDGLFYLDSISKDAKLNFPLQTYANNCDADCANALESGLSGSSLANVGNNLTAFRALFAGHDGIGFDDYLIEVGSNELAQQMLANLDTAIASQTELGASLVQQLQQTPAQVQQLHDQTKAVTDQLKVDFINSLALDLPPTSAGDND
ncbi:imelysin family protein [uncultured Ferrimonas sp.]|uniref:imelysin family protein n=1 Tax=uncultured Ferrimonas sp. TaxID=432640 RepID=UPI002605EF17|nr:imelysin family protein [uncultured Ferrimonas sp.]